jgi:PhzF family phenazine biosynthesis protein
MKKLNYQKIDAFTTEFSTGNPAACIYLEKGQTLTDIEMLNIAKEHKGFVSEVVFCTPQKDKEYRLKYYSSECEVDFCGHGTIACIYSLLKGTKDLTHIPQITIYTKHSSLTVYNEIDSLDAVFITAPEPQYLTHDLNISLVSDALKITPQAISREYPIELINAGLKTLIVPISSLNNELSIFPDEYLLKEFCLNHSIDIVLSFTTEVSNSNNKIRTRVFAPKFGYLEDKATGSGNSAFGYYMLKHNMWDGRPISIEQNGEYSAYNIIWLKTLNNRVLFGGRANVRIEGMYFCNN